ncbi:hypothetical protein N825_03645 [Skermanella stibiiresistens SB22]|uniref:Uncharacterized protein n=1 Tax=Skermanella stibiiresistens SB22 TaxID=1385369 RepID=W9H283_9PROT|nr:hypothetical protein [Skermanella stibiiresistens]EWY40149.1 hypothetical protein N825_03645 [Skermanella stibiiresistens SB22]
MILAALLLPISAAMAQAPVDRNPAAPYRFSPPPRQLDPVDRGRAELYRDQLRQSETRREQLDGQGKLDTLDRRELLDTRNESRRMDRTLGR